MSTDHVLLRSEAPEESTWNPALVFPTWADWEQEYNDLCASLPALEAFAGRLGEGPEILVGWLETFSRFRTRVVRLGMFAYMASAVDTTQAEPKGRAGQADGLLSDFQSRTAFAEPEILALGTQVLGWSRTEPRLATYAHYFENLLRQQAHRRSAEVEAVLGGFEEIYYGIYKTYGELTDTDLKFAEARDSQGQPHPVRQVTDPPPGIDSPDRRLRQTAWESYADGYRSVQNTLAGIFLSSVKYFRQVARARGYGSVLESVLEPYNLPVEVFHNLIARYRANLPVWQRYWEVRRRALGLEEIHPYDLFAPLTATPLKVSYQQAVDWIGEALRPLGEEYVAIVRKACLEERWVDWAPNAGKTAGGFTMMSSDCPSWILMGYDDSISSMSTLSHELGHAVHGYLIDKNQPAIYNVMPSLSGAETASNFNQAMLRAYLLKENIGEPDLQLALLDEALSVFHRYFFMMPTLARFEDDVYRRAESGEPLTAEFLNTLMADLFAEGYGTTMSADRARTAITWAQFGHLYQPFYPFQYAIGLSAAHALADKILSGEPAAAEAYLRFLKTGGSQYPMEAFRQAGVDLTTPEPVERTFKILEGLVDRLESLADSR